MQRASRFASALMAATLSGGILAASSIPFARAAEADVQLVRPGDGAMTCTALADEINTLAQPAVTPASATTPAPKKKKGFGFLKMLTGAIPMVSGVAGMGGAVVSAVAGAAASGQGQDAGREQMDEMRAYTKAELAGPTVREQRKDRLTGMFEQKGC